MDEDIEVVSMGFPADPAVGDVHVFTDDHGRKIDFRWDGICWTRVDDAAAEQCGRRLAT